MRAIAFFVSLWIVTVAFGQSAVSPESQSPKSAPRQSKSLIGNTAEAHLVRVDAITARSEMIGIFRFPLACDSTGNIYLRNDSGAQSPILKLNPKGERLALFDATQNPDLKIDVGSYFSVDADGRELYELVYPHEMSRYVFIYGSDGKFKSAVKLQPGFTFLPSKLAVFPRGQFLISGLEYDADKNAAMWPFTGIFGADGSLLKEIELEDDKTLHDMAASGDTRVALPGNAQGNRAVSGSQVEVGADGNAYLMRWTNPAIFYVISPGGELVRRFTVDPGYPSYRPAAMHVHSNRVAVLFTDLEKDQSMMAIVDLEGQEIAKYDELKVSPQDAGLGVAFACYTENPTRFTFLGSTDDNRLQLLTAEPK